MRSDMRRYWRRPEYWRWWWEQVVTSQTKWGLAALAAVGFGILGYVSAERLTPSQQAAAFTTERVITVVGKSSANASRPEARASLRPAQTVTVVTSQPGEAKVVTVRRGGRTVVVHAPGETTEHALATSPPAPAPLAPPPSTETALRTEP